MLGGDSFQKQGQCLGTFCLLQPLPLLLLPCAVHVSSHYLPAWILCSSSTTNHNYTLEQEKAIDILSLGFFAVTFIPTWSEQTITSFIQLREVQLDTWC